MPDTPNYRIDTSQGFPELVCLRCLYRALSEQQLLIHMQMIHDEQTLQCDEEA